MPRRDPLGGCRGLRYAGGVSTKPLDRDAIVAEIQGRLERLFDPRNGLTALIFSVGAPHHHYVQCAGDRASLTIEAVSDAFLQGEHLLTSEQEEALGHLQWGMAGLDENYADEVENPNAREIAVLFTATLCDVYGLPSVDALETKEVG